MKINWKSKWIDVLPVMGILASVVYVLLQIK